MKFRPTLSLDLTSSSSTSSNKHGDDASFTWGQTTYRKDTFSIGHDYFRLEGRTITRGLLSPERLEMQHVLGRGNFSTVRLAQWHCPCQDNNNTHEKENYHDRDRTTTIPVAVKQLSLTQTSQKRHVMLLKELRTMCLLESEFLVTLHGAFLQQDTVYVVMEMMNQGSLEDFFNRHSVGTHLTDDLIATLSWQILTGLSHLHAHGMIHRDVKPANILLNSKGHVKLCDFGMTTWTENSIMHTTVVGTTKYMAPERLRGLPYGRSSDLWSFGLVLWQCVTGKEPWQDVQSLVDLVVTVEEMDMEHEFIPMAGCIHPGLLELLVGCLQKVPGKRIPPSLLLDSPWFCQEHQLVSSLDSWLRLQQLLIEDNNITNHNKKTHP